MRHGVTYDMLNLCSNHTLLCVIICPCFKTVSRRYMAGILSIQDNQSKAVSVKHFENFRAEH